MECRLGHVHLSLVVALAAVLAGCPFGRGPTADFTAEPASGVVPLTVQFTDQSDAAGSPITSWDWQFGDGSGASVADPTHIYTDPGAYDVTLAVTTARGSDTVVVEGCVTALPSGQGGGVGALLEVPAPLEGANPVLAAPTAAVPDPGETVADTAFGTAETRVTSTQGLRHEYARIDPFNADRSLVLLMYLPEGEWRVYSTAAAPYDRPGGLVGTLDFEEPRWDPVDPNTVWGTRDFQVLRRDVATKAQTVVKDFAADSTVGPILTANPDLYRITMRDEGESSTDKRYWAFALQGSQDDYRCRYLFTWDRAQDDVLGVYALPTAQSRIDWVGMSPQGTWVVIGGDFDNAAPLNGLVIADKALAQFHRLDTATAHSDVGLDASGNEVIVMQGIATDYVDMIPLDFETSPITDPGGSYAGTNRTPLVRLNYNSESPIGLNSGVHISCNYPGYCVVSTYSEPGAAAQNWLDRKIILVRLDASNPRAYYLAHVRGTTGAYWEETHASISRDGSRVVWATNWSRDVGEERVWLMQLTIPWD